MKYNRLVNKLFINFISKKKKQRVMKYLHILLHNASYGVFMCLIQLGDLSVTFFLALKKNYVYITYIVKFSGPYLIPLELR